MTTCQFHVQRTARGESPTLVMLHGWGSNSAIWSALTSKLPEELGVVWVDLPGFGEHGDLPLNDFSNPFLEQLPAGSVLVGWSLGGMLAVRLAASSENIIGLVTIGTNACFVANEVWPHAMQEATFLQFKNNFCEDAKATFTRFLMLQSQGDGQRKQVLKALMQCQSAPEFEQLERWVCALNWLGEWDNCRALQSLQLPQLHILGKEDQLVPSACADSLSTLNERAKVEVLDGVGHVPHVSAPRSVAAKLVAWLGNIAFLESEQRSKKDVARSFSRAAKVYDEYAHLQQRVALRLLSMRSHYAGSVLDVGCGTGFCLERIAAECDNVTGIDLSPGMLEVARAKQLPNSQWLCADMEAMPLPSNAFDLIVSSLSIQWCEHLAGLFEEFARTLKPGGRALVATLGPETLSELRHAWQTVNQYTHVNSFDEPERVVRAAEQAGLEIDAFISEPTPVYYENAMDLMRELKAIGAHNVNRGKNQGLTGKRQIQAVIDAYEPFRQADGRLPATYQVLYFQLVKPQIKSKGTQ